MNYHHARQFQWYWADVVIDDEFNEVAMISRNQEMIIFPFSFTAGCIAKQYQPNTPERRIRAFSNGQSLVAAG